MLAAAIVAPLLFATRSAAAGSCVRPTDPGGVDDYAYGSATVRSFGNDKVLVWYATDGTHAVDLTSTRSDLVPDDVAEVAQVTSDALGSYATMGFRAPVSDQDPSCGSNGGDGRLDVYLVHMVGGDGMTVAEPGRCTSAGKATRCASFVLAQSSYAALYPTASEGIHTVLPHETFHAVQNAYDSNLDRFWAEGTAQWAAKTLDPSLTDLERFLPDFFEQTARALDAPSNGVTSAFLYGAAIWPVYLTARHGGDVVRQVLEQEGLAGDDALDATDAVLQADEASSMAAEFPLFAAWNAATGKRAGSGGYAEAASYPEVAVSELEDGAASGITSGYASFYFHVKTDSTQTVTLDTDAARNAGLLVPLTDGVAHVDEAKPLPADLDGEAIIVVSGTTGSKKDAPFSIALSPTGAGTGPATPASDDGGGGCAIASAHEELTSEREPFAALGVGFVALALIRRRRARL